MRYYRVHAYVPGAAAGENGHPLFVWPRQGSGRIDNPAHYLTLYVADTPAGAVGETFGDHAIWTDDLLAGPASLPGSVRALSAYDGSPPILDLDDASTLLESGLRPSRVVSRHKVLTQAWALSFFQTQKVAGLRWWSYHLPEWGSLGLWDRSALTLASTSILSAGHPAVVEAGAILNRPWKP